MEIQHFNHEHPLTSYEEDDNFWKHNVCSICRLPLLSTPSYICGNGCTFFLHKACTQLPQYFYHPWHMGSYRHHNGLLSLTPKPSGNNSNCQNCLKLCQDFTYSCGYCKFDLHLFCAKPVQIITKHKSHQSHPLVAICRETLSFCDACGEEQKGFFFTCQDCNFWIHPDCTLLPSVAKHASHPHPFTLTYALSDLYKARQYCVICDGLLHGKGMYFCGHCRCTAHLKCATSNMESETRDELIYNLPDEGDTFPSLMIRTISESKRIADGTTSDKLTVEKCHKHPLIFHENDQFLVIKDDEASSNSREASLVQELMCNACIQPISAPFYRCPQPDCHFLIHSSCANLPSKISFLAETLVLVPDPSKYLFYSAFVCQFCRRPCNGFGYYYEKYPIGPGLVDIQCASAPNTIRHASHGHHILFLTTIEVNDILFSCCSDKSSLQLFYKCISCDFMIHLRCALLPKRSRHKFDKHPLELTTHSDEQEEGSFCEFCEEEINQNYWFYHCDKCDQSFHVNCIPSVGLLSRIKFDAGTLKISLHPDHPLTPTRMLTVGSQRCRECKNIIEGFVDDLGLHCPKCDFWVHFYCADITAMSFHITI